MPLLFDHLVIGCLSLEAARGDIEKVLGPTDQGGAHKGKGTHNLLWKIEAGPQVPGLRGPAYLELLAPDPAQATPAEAPLLYGVGRPAMRQALAHGPRPIAWVAKAHAMTPAELEKTVAACPAPLGPLSPLSRGGLSWRLTLAPGGAQPGFGAVPAVIEWPGEVSPADTLPETGIRLVRFARRPSPRAEADPEAALTALGLADMLPVAQDAVDEAGRDDVNDARGGTGGQGDAPEPFPIALRAVLEGPGGVLRLA